MDFFQAKYEILLKEWEHTNTAIGRLDGLVFILRGWAVTVTTGAVAYAYSTNDRWVAVYIVLPILIIWLNDALYKHFQDIFILRNKEIEDYLSSDEFRNDFESRHDAALKIPSSSDRFVRGKRLVDDVRHVLRCGRKNNVILTYVPLLLLAIVSALLVGEQPEV